LNEEERTQVDRLAVELRVTAGEVMRRALGELYARTFKSRGQRGE
jgi:hypothetical protein